MSYTIDASVFVSAAFSKELHHQESLEFLSAVRKQGEDIIAVRIAIDYRLRGADAVYAAVAKKFNAILVTWDKEMYERGSSVVKTMMP